MPLGTNADDETSDPSPCSSQAAPDVVADPDAVVDPDPVDIAAADGAAAEVLLEGCMLNECKGLVKNKCSSLTPTETGYLHDQSKAV